MANARIDQMVILAAGMGSRIRGEAQPLPKPLVRVGGLPLLKRAILTAKKAGVRRFVIVLGCDADRVRGAIDGDRDLDGLELRWVLNERYALKNGVSVLAARPYVDGEFFLTMADHVVDPAIYEKLQHEPARRGLVLAVDRKLDTIFDMDDATKVRIGEHERIASIGKTIPEFDAVDTGVFRCAPALFEALDNVFRVDGDVSLSEGVQALAANGRARVADVGAAWWQDVDDIETRKHAERLLFSTLTKPLDGPVSRHINRRFSKTITRLVMNTPVVPNHMTAVGLLVGLAAAAVTAMATASSLWMLALGGVLFQLASMIDGCDGEIARLKFKHSDWGEWFDTISDDVINLSYMLSVGYALFTITGAPIWLQLSVGTLLFGGAAAAVLYRKLIASGKGTHLAMQWGYQNTANPGFFSRLFGRIEFVAHRDFYALVMMCLALVGGLKVVVVLSFVTSAIVFGQSALSTVAGAASPQPARRPEPARSAD